MKSTMLRKVAGLIPAGLALVLSMPLISSLSSTAFADETICTPELYTTSPLPWAQEIPLIAPETVADQVAKYGLDNKSFQVITRGTVIANLSFPKNGTPADLSMRMSFLDGSEKHILDKPVVIAVPDSTVDNADGTWDYTVSTDWPYQNYGSEVFKGPQQGIVNLGHNFNDFNFDNVAHLQTNEVFEVVGMPAGAEVDTSQPQSNVDRFPTLPFGVQFSKPGIYKVDFGTEFTTNDGKPARITKPLYFAVGSEVVDYLLVKHSISDLSFPARPIFWTECPGPHDNELPPLPDKPLPEVPVPVPQPEKPVPNPAQPKPEQPIPAPVTVKPEPVNPVVNPEPIVPAKPTDPIQPGNHPNPVVNPENMTPDPISPLSPNLGEQSAPNPATVSPVAPSTPHASAPTFQQETSATPPPRFIQTPQANSPEPAQSEKSGEGLISPNRVTAAPGVTVTSQDKPKALSRSGFELDYVTFIVIAVSGIALIGGGAILAFSSMATPKKIK